MRSIRTDIYVHARYPITKRSCREHTPFQSTFIPVCRRKLTTSLTLTAVNLGHPLYHTPTEPKYKTVCRHRALDVATGISHDNAFSHDVAIGWSGCSVVSSCNVAPPYCFFARKPACSRCQTHGSAEPHGDPLQNIHWRQCCVSDVECRAECRAECRSVLFVATLEWFVEICLFATRRAPSVQKTPQLQVVPSLSDARMVAVNVRTPVW